MNRWLGITILAVAGATGLAWLVAVIESLPAKAVLVVVGELFLSVLGILVFKFYHYPRALRLTQASWYAALAVTMLAMGAPLGLAGLEYARWSAGEGKAWFDIRFAGPSSAAIVIAGLTAMYVFNRDYMRLQYLEQTRGISI